MNSSAPGLSSTSTTLVDVLAAQGKLTPAQVDDIVLEQIRSGKTADKVLESGNFVDERSLAQAKSELYQVPWLDLNTTGASPEALALLSDTIARQYQVLPFAVDKSNRVLKVVMADPLDLEAVEFIRQKTGFNVESFMATPSEVSKAIDERYAQSLSSEVSQALKDSATVGNRRVLVAGQAGDTVRSGELLRDAPIAKIVETVLTFAVEARASDIHIESLEEKTRIRYRIDGILQEKLVLPKTVHDALVSRVKILSDLKIDEKRIPQDGRFTFRLDDREVDLRVSTLPTVHGEKIVMRLLQKGGKNLSLVDLGLRGAALEHMKEALKVPHGIILVTGPTGSGKTTTLYAALTIINQPTVNIVTLEDPVEYQLEGINQVQVNPQAGLTFASGLRAFLRQDPNIIMVGEIRDEETAGLAVQASLTGHLVLSTIHTNSAAGALPRLLDMKAEPFLLASSMTLVMAQRVVRKVNPELCEEYVPPAPLLDDIKKTLGPALDVYLKEHNTTLENIKLRRPIASLPAGESGYRGRIGIFEVMPITQAISKLILSKSPASSIEEAACKEGMLLMKQDGYLKALDGITSIEEVLRVAQI